MAYNLDSEQISIAKTIISIGKARGIPARGWIVAIATALQESGMRNLNYGDRDSLGVFQQRPSAGWGTPAQVTNVSYATNKFYDALLKVPNWQSLPVTVAAQDVQRSAYPLAYAKWEPEATWIVQQYGDANVSTDAIGVDTGSGSSSSSSPSVNPALSFLLGNSMLVAILKGIIVLVLIVIALLRITGTDKAVVNIGTMAAKAALK